MLEKAASDAEHLIIGVGSCNREGTKDNPFSAQEREMMIAESLKIPVTYEFVRIPDFKDNGQWIRWIRDNIRFDVFKTNSPREREIFEKEGIKVEELPFYNRPEYWATEVRKRVIEDGDWRSLLPDGTMKVLEEIGGIERIRRLNGN